MIDIENQVFDRLCVYLEAKRPGINMSGDTLNAPTEFPCVALEEVDNYPDRRTQDSIHPENHAIIVLEATVYSNKAVGRKQEARAIAGEVSDLIQSLGFTRISMNPAPVPGGGHYRLKLRFRAEVSAMEQIYRR